jgi:hypothetical protein
LKDEIEKIFQSRKIFNVKKIKRTRTKSEEKQIAIKKNKNQICKDENFEGG